MTNALPSIRLHGVGTFAAFGMAERFLATAGFSMGSSCAGQPTCIMFGDYAVAKWRNLTQAERGGCHGKLTGDHRHGPIMIELLPACPAEGIAAFVAAASDLEGIA